jgi:hypothetical protein
MQGSISLTNQKKSVVSGREFAICCAHGLCSLAYCFSHCALDFDLQFWFFWGFLCFVWVLASILDASAH